MSKIKFVGRKKELDILAKALSNHEAREIVLIEGEGSIGKSMLISKFYEKYHNRQGVKSTKKIDLSQVAFKQEFILLSHIAERFDENNFKEFNVKWSDYQKLQAQDGSAGSLKNAKEQAENTFINEFNKLASGNRLVLILDTFDKDISENEHIIYFFNTIIPKLNQLMLVVAGRESGKIAEWLKLTNPVIYLGKLGDEASKDLIPNVPEKYKSKVIKLAGENALILSLANVYFNIPRLSVPEILEENIDFIQNNLEKSKLVFEKQLFRIFGDFRYAPYPNYIMQMAFFEKRYNVDIMCHINYITENEANKILKELSKEFFVKNHPDEIHLLHDIFRDRLKELEWERFDNKEPKLRDEYGEKIQSWYDEKIRDFKNQIEKNEIEFKKLKDSNKVALLENANYKLKEHIGTFTYEKYFYAKKTDIETAYNDLEKEINSAISNDDIKYIKLLSDLITKEDLNNHFGLKYEFARYCRSIAQFDRAGQLLKELIEKDLDEKHKISYFQTYGFNFKDRGFVEKGIEKIRESIKLTEKFEQDDYIIFKKAENFNNLGYLYISIGKYNRALENFEKCYEIIEAKYSSEFFELEGRMTGRWGLALMLSGKIPLAKRKLNQAIEISKEQKNDLLINTNKLILAQIEIKKCIFAGAYILFDEIESYFKQKEDNKWLAILYMDKSRALYEDFMVTNIGLMRGANLVEKEEWLEKTHKLAIKSNELCENYHPAFFAKALMNTGDIELEFAKLYKGDKKLTKRKKYLDEAKISIDRALQIATDEKNIKIIINTLKIFAEYYYEIKDSENLRKIILLMDKENIEGAPIHAFKGEVYFLMAKDYLRKGQEKNNEKAFENYRIALPYLAEPGEWAEYKFSEYLDEIGNFLIQQNKNTFDVWIKKLRNEWESKGDNEIPEAQQQIIDDFFHKIKRSYHIKLGYLELL